MANEFTCRYCGTHQTWSGTGPMVCEKCGASQPANDQSAATAKPVRGRGWIWMVLIVLTLLGFLLLWLRHRSQTADAGNTTQGSAEQSRVVSVENPVVLLMPKDVKFSPEDIVNAMPKVKFPSDQLQIVSKERIRDEDNRYNFVAELKNTSPTLAVASPVGKMQLMRGDKVVYTEFLSSEDLAPGQSSPFIVKPGDIGGVAFDRVQMEWSPLQGYSPTNDGAAQLEAQITSQTVSPSTETVNFTQVFHYNTMEIHGTVRNTGHATARHVKVYAVLRDPKGLLAGYTEQDVTDSLAAGAKADFQISVDEWGGAVAKVDIIPVQITPP